MIRKRSQGMSLLLEVVVGFGIFVTAILFVFGLFVSSQRATVASKNLAIANDLAREEIENQLSKSYPAVSNAGPTDLPIAAEVDGVNTSTTFSVTVAVTTEPPGPAPNDFERKQVVVRVAWPEATGAQRKVELETYVAP